MVKTESQGACRSTRELDRTRVLIVDDEDDARELLRYVLEAWGAEVLDAPSVADALETLESADVDAIVSDIAMPGRDGYSLIKEVRSSPQTAAIPAIALTAFAGDEDQARALRAGFDLHVGKPFDCDQLRTALARLVESARST